VVKHPLISTLLNLEGNPRSILFTEPLWGIPYNLYIPYVSVYMLALGVRDSQIGLITSIGLALQIATSLLGGAITDKLGRKRTTLIFDILSWSVPCLIWAVAQNFYYFLAAAVVNSLWRITMNSWTCLMVEDAPKDKLVNMYAWVYIAGLAAAFFSPIAGVLINQFSLIPTMRGLFVFALVMMTTKFLVLNYFAVETRHGQVRMEETRGKPLRSLVGGYGGVLAQLLRTPHTLASLGIMLVISITATISTTFWAILVTEKLGIPTQNIAIFPFVKSVVMLGFFFLILPRISSLHFKRPMLLGFCGYVIAELLLVSMPEKNYLLLLTSTFLEAASLALVSPLMDSMVILTVDPQERARIQALMYVVVISLTSPFGWIAGRLSEVNRTLPFVLNIFLFATGAMLVLVADQVATRQRRAAAPVQGD
jgi:MFS family permease